MNTLTKGNEPNLLKLIVDEIEIKPYSQIKSGNLEDGLMVKISRYNLENLLCQMIDEYGEDVLIEKIKSL